MPKDFNTTFVDKSPEEIKEIIKQKTIPFLKIQFKQATDYIEHCAKNRIPVSNEARNSYNIYFKSIDNIDETVEASMRERAIELYKAVERLNFYCGDRDTNNKVRPVYNNIMNLTIFPIINGFGEQSKALYEQIANTPYIEPDLVFHTFIQMNGIDAITQKEFEKLGGSDLIHKQSLSPEEITKLAELEIRRGDNVRFGLLNKTKMELINELTNRYNKGGIHL